MQMQKLIACFCVAGAFVIWASPIHAQTVSPALIEPSAQSGQTEPAAKIESFPLPPPSVDSFVAKLDSATRAIHESSKKDVSLVRRGCHELLSEILDLDEMVKASNAEIWDAMTESQRATIRAAFEQRMIGNCVRQFGSYEGEIIHLAGVRRADGGQLLATVRVGPQDNNKLVTWKLSGSGPDNWRAVDVITEGRSIVSDARNEFAAVLQSVNGDIEALIAFMRK